MDFFVNKQLLDGGIAEISFFHTKSNALPSHMLDQLAKEIQIAGLDANINLIILKSEGKAFCAGASFDELIEIEDLETGTAFFKGFAKVINAIRKCAKLVIGRVHGKAVGGGVGLAAATDYCLATTDASIKLSELNIGIGPFVIEPAVSRKVGLYNFTMLTLHPDDFFDANWARNAGLYSELFENQADLDLGLTKLCESLVMKNPEARTALKKVFWEGTGHWDKLLDDRAAMSGKMVLSEFTKKSLSKFKKVKA